MKTRRTVRSMNILLTLMFLTFSVLTLATAQREHSHDMQGSSHKGEMPGHGMAAEKARCAFDGMLMKASAMVSMRLGDETLYFCNETQKALFEKAPKRYLKRLTVGDRQAFMHVLTIKEYREMMESMGMGKMTKVDDPNATHYIGVHLADDHEPPVSNMLVQVTSPDGKTAFRELRYDKMMKSHVGVLPLLKSGKYHIQVLLASNEVLLP